MTRRRLHFLAVLLLPLLALRGLLPTGYMAAQGEHGLRLVMCSQGLQVLAHHGDHDGQPPAGDDCPFALSAFSAPPRTHHSADFQPVLLQVASSVGVDRPATAFGPPRSAAARGPPASA